MAAGLTKRITGSVVLMGVLFAVLVVSLYVLSNTTESVDSFGKYYFWLLITDAVVLIFIAILIAANSVQMLREFRRRVAGSRLTVKLIIMSVFLALVPVTLVYLFSVKFLTANIDSFFDIEVEEVLQDALELSRDSLDQQMRVMRRVTTEVAGQVAGVPRDQVGALLETLGGRIDASELSVLDRDNTLLASTGFFGDTEIEPERPPQSITLNAAEGLPYVGVDPYGAGDLVIRVVVPVLRDDDVDGHDVLQALYPVGKRSSELALGVQESYQRYQQMAFLSNPLKLSSLLTLSLTLALSVLTALWFAFYAARRMMVPIHNLVEGTKQIAEGDYSIRIYKHGNDEIRYLVDSFNEMTGRLEQSSILAEQSRQRLESQRAYLETVLRHISTGVLALDADGMLNTVNDAAAQILGEDIKDLFGLRLTDAGEQASAIHQFVAANQQYLGERQDWTQEVEIFGPRGRRLLLCRGAQLRDPEGRSTGVVVVFDDITSIVQAQRNAAWSEVARRLAHEIKNPLTPIQLSAERLRRKYLDKMQGEDAQLLDRLTHTIVQQVDAMKSMVKAFADYADAPAARFVRTDFNSLVLEVVDLYRDVEDKVDIALQLGTNLPTIPADVTRMRQLLHNLIKNALEAQKDSEHAYVLLETCLRVQGDDRQLQVRVEDRGPGFPLDQLDMVFEPYVTSKPKGTGLGLAIVKKIVEEHNGLVMIENNEQGGASVIMRFPIPASAPPMEFIRDE
ncbi:ATP-binding protein [Granulosicoccaceae sp. 1_MG-2023]|nr:ATP-binding protein [Granulosicoccaceae sp. 1_MG-2023]